MHERRMAGRTGRAVARPVRVARTHAPRVLLAAFALIVVLSQVGTAYALPWQEKDGYPLGEILMCQDVGANRGTVVYGAANEFFATLCLIGRKSDYLQLSPDQLSELSGEGTGGAFWELSQRWNNYEADGSPDSWPIGITAAMQGQGLISDPAYIWWADYSYYEQDSLYNRALADYLTIYNGGHLGGGSSGDYYDFRVVNTKGAINPAFSGVTTIRVPKTFFTFNPSGEFQNALLMISTISNNSSNIDDVAIKAVFGDATLTENSSQVMLSFTYGTGFCDIERTGWKGVNINGNVCELRGTFGSTIDQRTNNSSVKFNYSIYYSDAYIFAVYEGSGSGGGGGGGTWPEPDPPSPPSPPDVPQPGPNDDPGIELPDPYMPIVDPVTDPDPITDPYVVVVAPDSTDIIEWLRAILRAINNLGDKLNAESTELQNALNKVFFNNLSRLLKNLKGEFIQDYSSWLNKELQWLNSEIHGYFVDFQNYLYRLFDWLADQMNFEVNLETDPYDDTSLLNWLRRIYNKLGADSGPNTRPVDPSTDEDGFLDWLRRMFQNFILDLGAAASDVVSDLGDLLSRLFAKFPFSVPWDLLAILGILDAPTMVPRLTFDIPLTMGTSTITWHVDVDMEPWSVYMEAVRTILLVSFISWLIWLTPQVLRDLDPGDFL